MKRMAPGDAGHGQPQTAGRAVYPQALHDGSNRHLGGSSGLMKRR